MAKRARAKAPSLEQFTKAVERLSPTDQWRMYQLVQWIVEERPRIATLKARMAHFRSLSPPADVAAEDARWRRRQARRSR